MPKPKVNPVRARRKAKGLKGVELARLAGLTPSHLCDIEAGRIPLPRIDFALSIADVLGADVRDLFPNAVRRAA